MAVFYDGKGTWIGLAADKPAASAQNKGMTYFTTDTGLAYVSTGAAWVAIGGSGTVKPGTLVIPYFGNVSAATNVVINNTAYSVPAFWALNIDNTPGYTHFAIYCDGQSNEGGQTVSIQAVADWASPATPLSAGGNDVVKTNTRAAGASAWIPIASVGASLANFGLAVKGSNGTVDLTVNSLSVSFAVMA